ncbi:PIR protein, partial [Plasmodium vivax]
MDRNLGIYRSSFYNWKKYNGGHCYNKYSTTISEIEEKIDKFNKVQHQNFYHEWKKLNNIIKQKNNEIKGCIAEGHISYDLYAVDTINNFSIRCRNPKAHTCSNNPTSHIKESSSLKKTVTERSCISGKGCNKETATKREEKPKLQPGVPAGNPKRISSSRLQHKDQRPQVPTGNEPINTRVISQSQPSTTHTVPLVAQVEVPEHEVHRDSITSEQGEDQTKLLDVPESSKVIGEETPPRDTFVPTVINYETATGHSSGIVDSGINTIQDKLSCNETFDGNLSCQHHISDQDLPRNEGNDKALSSNIRDTTFMTAGVSLGEKPSDKDHVGASPKVADLVSVTSSEQPGEETVTESVSGDVSTINSAGSEIKNSSDGNFSNEDTDTQDFPNKILCAEGSSDKMLSSDAPCKAEIDSGLVADNGKKSDIFEKFLEAISNKDHIVQASAPMGIVMLLGLLFK